MSYLSLARKYRPSTFADLVGQESVGLALANAIRLKREPRGVIFTGVRGIGKTTTARIYAKALNCEKGPTPEPCNVCPSCVAIQQGTHEDVLEIDGASNTGVDDVRALQETLAYVPQRSSFKIYIIDEVHMLSVSAFNALLKTLEEPPEHVVFIFATTELHKVPETIQSRCQVFHLQKISTQQSKKRLADILNAEGIAFDDRAIQWVAREGRGSLRDALTLLDQVIAVGGGTVSWAAVEPMVNTGHAEPIYEMLGLLLAKNAQGLLEVIARWDQEGLPMATLVEELIKASRNAFVLKSLPKGNAELEILDLEERELEALRKIGQDAKVLDLNRLFRSFVKCLDDLRNSELDRFVVENYALEWCLDPGLPDLTGLIQGGVAQLAKSGSSTASQSQVSAPANQAQAVMGTKPQVSEPAAPKGGAPAMDLRNRWKQTSGQAKVETPVQAAPTVVASAGIAANTALQVKPGASAVEALAPPRGLVETQVKVENQDQLAAQAIAQTHIAPPPRPAPVQEKRESIVPPQTVSESIAKPAVAPARVQEASPSLARSGAGADRSAEDDLPPWLTDDDDPGFEEFSIINEISSAPKPAPAAPVAAAKPNPSPAAVSATPSAVATPKATVPPVAAPQASPTISKPAMSEAERLESLLSTQSPQPTPVASPSPAPSVAASAPQGNWPASWKDFVDEWKKQKPLQARVLEETYAVAYTPERIKLAVEAESLAGQKLLHIDTRKKLLAQFEALFGFRGVFEVIPKSELAEAPQETLLETKQKVKAKEREDLRVLLENHPLTREALSEFGGTIESIEVQ